MVQIACEFKENDSERDGEPGNSGETGRGAEESVYARNDALVTEAEARMKEW